MTPKQEQQILVGYKLGTGEPVYMSPVHHTMITGLTGQAGKTTAVLGIASRWPGQKFVVFKTKIGEQVFDGLRTITPYFREQKATWQSIEALIEASLGEKIGIIRTTLMKVTQGASTIEQVFANVKKKLDEMDKRGKSGFDYDMLYQVREYLRQVSSDLGRYKFADKLELHEGVNVVDLTEMALSDNAPVMMAMVVGATADEILKRHKNTSLVVPEAWQIIPGDRKTPAHLPVETLIRQGIVQHNYVIIDSQDVAGVKTKIREHVGNYLIGRISGIDENELRRAIKAIPLPPKLKPKPEDVQTLQKGQFYAVLGGVVSKIYARPADMSEEDAIARAKAGSSKKAIEGDDWEAKTTTHPFDISKHPMLDDLDEEIKDLKQRNGELVIANASLAEQRKEDLEQIRMLQEEISLLKPQVQAFEGLRQFIDARIADMAPKTPTGYAITNSDGQVDIDAEDVEVVVTETMREEKLDESTYEGKLCILLADKQWTTTISKGAVEDLLTKNWGTSWGGSSRKALSAALERLSHRPYSLVSSNSHGWGPTEKGLGIKKEQLVS